MKNERVNDFKLFLKGLDNGLEFKSGDKVKRSKKTNKQKLVDSISKEIKIMSDRTDLNLKLVGDSDRTELRFHNKPNKNVVDFNIKYKSKIVRLFEDEVIKCENNIDTYLSLLKDVKSFVEGMEEDDVRFDVVE